MNATHSLQALLDNTATEGDIALLKHLLASGEISIGGNVNQSVIIIGSGNTVELPPAALDRLNARPMLGNLDRDLTGEEIAAGLRRLDKLLPNRAPVLLPHYKEQVGRLRPTLKTEIKSLSETARRERVEALAAINSICVEALDVSFNGLALGEAAPDYDARSPFRGLESFRPEDSEFFFGREALTRKLVAQIQAHPFLAVLGASGSGKSSLVMAGVIPALDSDYAIFRPGTKPLSELESARGKSLIVVDQFEELFTLTRDQATRKDFIASLLDESTRARIILTLRSDFLGEVGAYRTLSAEIQNHLEIIPPMDLDELRRAMEGQAGVVGLRFEADLSQQILDDVAGEPGAMPLLQHALWELWNRRHGRNLRASEYRAFGGVKQAITSTAEKIYADCSKPEQNQLRDIFLRLTRLDDSDEGRDTRRRVPLGDLIPSGRDAASITLLLDKLANARLIVKTVNEDKTEVEVAHEALIRHWERLRLWLNEDRDALRLRESVSESAKEWERSGKHESLLNSRWVKLDEAFLLAEDSRYRLTEIEQAYLKGCLGLRNREQQERERRLRYTVFTSIAAAVIFLVLVIFGLVKSNEATVRANEASTAQVNAEEQAKIANARALISQAREFQDSYPQRSLLLSIEANKLLIDTPYELLSKQTIFDALGKYYGTPMPVVPGKTQDVTFSPDKKWLVVSDLNSEIQFWDIEDLSSPVKVFFIEGNIYEVSFNLDGNWVFVYCDEKTFVFDTQNLDRKPLVMEFGYFDYASNSLLSINQWLVVEVNERTLQILNKNTPGNNSITLNTKESIESVYSSPNGEVLAVTLSEENKILVWRFQNFETEPISIRWEGDYQPELFFSPNGKFMAIISDQVLRLWDIQATAPILLETIDEVSDMVFSADGNWLVVSYGDYMTVYKIDDEFILTEVTRVQILAGEYTFSPDGSWFVVEDYKTHSAFFWDVSAGFRQSFSFNYVGNYDYSFSTKMLFSEDGKRLAIRFGENNQVYLWDMQKINESPIILSGNEAPVFDLSFSPSGSWLAASSIGGGIRMYDLDNFEIYPVLIEGEDSDWAEHIEFSPNGNWLVASSWRKLLIRNTLNIFLTPVFEFEYKIMDVTPSLFKFSSDEKWLFGGGYDLFVINTDDLGNSPIYFDVGPVSSMDVSPNNYWLAYVNGDVGLVDLRQIERGSVSLIPEFGNGEVIFSPDGKWLAAGNWKGDLWIINIENNFNFYHSTFEGNITALDFSLDSRWLVVESESLYRIDMASPKFDRKAIPESQGANEFAFSGDSNWLAFTFDPRIFGMIDIDSTTYIVNMLDLEDIKIFQEHVGGVYMLASDPQGSYIASVGEDYTVRLWNINNINAAPLVLSGFDYPVDDVKFNPRYPMLAVLSGGNIYMWDLQNDETDYICSIVGRNLSRSEWKKYIVYKPFPEKQQNATCPNLPIEPESTPSP